MKYIKENFKQIILLALVLIAGLMALIIMKVGTTVLHEIECLIAFNITAVLLSAWFIISKMNETTFTRSQVNAIVKDKITKKLKDRKGLDAPK